MNNGIPTFMKDLIEIKKYIKNDDSTLREKDGPAMSKVASEYLQKSGSVKEAFDMYVKNKEEFKNKLEEAKKEIDEKRAIKKQIQYSDTNLSDSSNNTAIISDSDNEPKNNNFTNFLMDIVKIKKYIKNDDSTLKDGPVMSKVVSLYLYNESRSIDIAIEKYNNNKEEFKNKLEETQKEMNEKRVIKKQIQYSDTNLSDSSNNTAIISDSDNEPKNNNFTNFLMDIVKIKKYIKNDDSTLKDGPVMSKVVSLYLYNESRSIDIAIEKYNNNKEEFKNKLEETQKEMNEKRRNKKNIG